jgi:hypothetical protein
VRGDKTHLSRVLKLALMDLMQGGYARGLREASNALDRRRLDRHPGLGRHGQ